MESRNTIDWRENTTISYACHKDIWKLVWQCEAQEPHAVYNNEFYFQDLERNIQYWDEQAKFTNFVIDILHKPIFSVNSSQMTLIT